MTVRAVISTTSGLPGGTNTTIHDIAHTTADKVVKYPVHACHRTPHLTTP